MSRPSLRRRLGCWLHERWRVELVLRAPALARMCGLSWLDLRNRNERLRREASTGGRACEWTDSSRLNVVRQFPRTGLRLLRHVLRDWPLQFARDDQPMAADGAPEVSILIPIGGSARMPQFRLALAAARGQSGVACEVLVVELAPRPSLRDSLPADVRYLHQAMDEGAEFNKSLALNAAARMAAGRCLLVLDADYLLPARFAAECARALQIHEAVRPARWIFHLDRASSERLAVDRDVAAIDGVQAVISNNPTPLALRRTTYWEIGGHDEAYAGWGGEDSEFLDRLRTRAIAEGGWMPVLHAWHAPAPKKADGDRNRSLHEAKLRQPAAQRIRDLVALAEGAGG